MPTPNEYIKEKVSKWAETAELNYQDKVIKPNKELIENRFSHLFDLTKLGISSSKPTSRASSVIFPDRDVQNPTIGSSLVSTASTGMSESTLF